MRHGAAAAATSRPDDARCLLARGSQPSSSDHLDERGLIAYMQEERLQPLRSLPARAAGRTSASCARRSRWRSARRAAERRAGAAEGLFEACIAAIPYAPATAFLANEQAKLAAIRRLAAPRRTARRRGRDPGRRHRLDARRHAHDRGDPPARRARLRDRGRRHRPRGRPPPAGRRRGRRALLPGPADRRAEPAGGGAGALRRRASTRSTSARPGPPGSPARSSPARSACRCSAATTPSSTAYAGLRSGDPRVAEVIAMGVRAFYSACDVVLSPSPASDGALAAIGIAARARAALGPRRRHRALRPARCATGCRCVCASASSTSSTPGASRARRASTCSPTRSCWPASATRACISCSPAAARRRSACASASATRRPSSAGLRAMSSPRVRRRRRVPVPERDRHLRSGDPRGAGERPAGPRRRRGRPACP